MKANSKYSYRLLVKLGQCCSVILPLILSICPASLQQAFVKQGKTHRKNYVSLLAVGDVMLAGPMEKLMLKKGIDYPFAAMKPNFLKADITFANLECCIANCGMPVPKKYNFRAKPPYASVLAKSGISIVSLANNHAWDYGREALLQTKQIVEQTGVMTAGAGANRTEAHQLKIVVRNGLKIGFLAYLGLFPPIVPESETEPCLAMGAMAAVRNEVTSARNLVDFLIVSLHCGVENAPEPSPHQIALSRAMIDSGADLVIGHHPHVVQETEIYHSKPICYSLGNFAFSASGRGSGQMLKAIMRKNKPIQIELFRLNLAGGQPHLNPNHSRNHLNRFITKIRN